MRVMCWGGSFNRESKSDETPRIEFVHSFFFWWCVWYSLSREYVVNGVPVHAPHPKHGTGTIEWCLYLDIFVDGCTLLRRLRTSRSTSYYNPTGSHSICVNHSGFPSVNICVVRGVDMVGERVKFNLHQPHNL